MAKEHISGFWKWFWIALAGVILATIWYFIITFGIASYYETEGNTYYYEEDYKKAIDAYKTSLKFNNNSAIVYNSLGYTYYMDYNDTEAKRAYFKALEIDPNNENATYNLGTLYYKQKEYDKALNRYMKVLEQLPNDIGTLYMVATIYQNKGEYKKAIEYLKKIVRLNPNSRGIYNLMGVAYSYNGQIEEAYSAFMKNIENNPQDDYIGYVNLFELELSQNIAFNKDLEEKFLEYYSDDMEAMMTYEMLKNLQKIAQGNSVDMRAWEKKYEGNTLNGWDFHTLERWLETIEDKSIKAKLKEAIEIAKLHRE